MSNDAGSQVGGSFRSHSSAMKSSNYQDSDDGIINDSTWQNDFNDLMDDKNFLFSKIKQEYSDEYRLLHGLRNMANPAQKSNSFYRLYLYIAIAISSLIVLPLLMV